MKAKLFFLPAVAALILSSPLANAAAVTCPDAQSLITVGLNYGAIDEGSWFATYAPNYEYTKDTKWNFAIGYTGNDVTDMTPAQALTKGKELLPSIKYAYTQEFGEYTICIFSTSEQDVIAAAVTPADNELPGFKKFIH